MDEGDIMANFWVGVVLGFMGGLFLSVGVLWEVHKIRKEYAAKIKILLSNSAKALTKLEGWDNGHRRTKKE